MSWSLSQSWRSSINAPAYSVNHSNHSCFWSPAPSLLPRRPAAPPSEVPLAWVPTASIAWLKRRNKRNAEVLVELDMGTPWSMGRRCAQTETMEPRTEMMEPRFTSLMGRYDGW